MSDELIAELGPLPRTHGLLGAMLVDPRPYRTATSAPTRASGVVAGRAPAHALVPGRADRRRKGTSSARSTSPTRRARTTFTDDEQELMEMLAAHAAIAIENARLFERAAS